MAFMKYVISDKLQTLTVYKINPNEQEQGGEVTFDRNVDGRVFYNCKFYVLDHAIIIENSEGTVDGVFSLHHYYLLKTN